jgi:hypothetical protein
MECGRHKLTGVCLALAAILALALRPCPAPGAEQAAPANAPATATTDPDAEAVAGIVKCLNRGMEAVLLSDSVPCTKYSEGSNFLTEKDAGMPLKLDVSTICDAQDKPKDLRRLTNTAIKKISALLKPPYNSLGMRIIGAIFCEQVDLVGLDLPFSLVLDRSFFRGGFEARNFHTSGDLSFDGSAALDTVRIARSRIGGTIFASGAYIKKLQILDSEIHGSLIFRNSTLPEPAIFDTIALSGELSVRQSALSYFFLQFSKVGGVLDLTDSQARCAYLVTKSEIGDLVAVDAGFGTSAPGDKFDWLPDTARIVDPPFKPAAASDASKLDTASDTSKCEFWKIALPGAFHVSDTRVRSSLCLRSFHWLIPRASGQGDSFITFNDLNVGATSFIDLGGFAQARANSSEKHKFEVVGLATHSLIFNFDTQGKVDEMSVSGLGFEQVYAAEVKCAYDPSFYNVPSGTGVERRLDNVSDPRSQLRLPHVNEVMAWLTSNCLDTTQPFAAFVDAAQKSGNDTDAKQFRIARADKELLLRINRAFGTGKASNCSADMAPKVADTQWAIGKAVTFMNDVVAIAFGVVLKVVAQHGYRPEQAGFFVLATLIGAAVYFWLCIRIVGFVPVQKDTVRPIGAIFLFDRLLPAYRIREEHYQIEAFYRRLRRSDRSHVKTLKYLWFKIPVEKASEKDTRRAELCLDIIKAIGLVLIIFLVAAINALFSH